MKKTLTLLTVLFSCICTAQDLVFPDENFKNKLLASSPSNNIAKDLSGNSFSIDANGDLEIQQSEADNVSAINLFTPTFDYYVTDITGINEFNNLVDLDVNSNNIGSIAISGLAFLKTIDCSNNGQYLDNLTLTDLPVLELLNCSQAGSNTSTPSYTLTGLPALKTINFFQCKFNSSTIESLTSLEEIHGGQGLKGNQTTIDLSNHPNLRLVEFGQTDLATITFPASNDIEHVGLFGTDVTTFDKTLFNSLKFLYLDWTKIVTLDVSGMTTLEDLFCDHAGSFATGYLTSLNVQGCTSLKRLICSRNELTELNVSGLSNLELLDCWGNDNIFSNVGLEVISLNGCTSLKEFIADSNPYLTEVDLSCSSDYEEIRLQGCEALERINLKNGVDESDMVAGGFSIYSCPNLSVVCVDFEEEFAWMDDAIVQTPYYNFIPGCHYNTLLGNVRFDIEGDGCGDDSGIEGIKILYDCPEGDCFTFTDSDGNFRLYTSGNSVTITPVNELFDLFDFGMSEPMTFVFEDTIVQNVDLCLAPDSVHKDLSVTVLPLTQPRPGEDYEMMIAYSNNGNQIQSGTISFSFDDAIMDLISSLPAATPAASMLQWEFTDLMPFETREIAVTFNINTPMEDPAVNGGDILEFIATITDDADETPANNTSVLTQAVVNSFDPNNKICLEGEMVTSAVIGDYVHYIINFENTGTANANNIVVRDIIDAEKFDVSSLDVLHSSHDVYARVTDVNEAEFIFEDIQLPFDDDNNDGFVAFRIKTLANLAVGDSFSNMASIYFDYNYPILTETFTSTIAILGIGDPVQNRFAVYPNPVRDILYLTGTDIDRIEVYDLNGKLLDVPMENNTLDLKSLNNGFYLVKIFSGKTVETAKIIKQ